MHIQFAAGLEAITAAQIQRGIAVAVFIRFDGKAGGSQRAFAGIEAIGDEMAHTEVEPGVIPAAGQIGRRLPGVVTAEHGAGGGGQFAAALAGENLDDAADGFGTIEAGERAAYDLDAFDLVERVVLE